MHKAKHNAKQAVGGGETHPLHHLGVSARKAGFDFFQTDSFLQSTQMRHELESVLCLFVEMDGDIEKEEKLLLLKLLGRK